jgi:hypothetical protein
LRDFVISLAPFVKTEQVTSHLNDWSQNRGLLQDNQTPMAVWRAGIEKIEAAAQAVDMSLRLDNANALSTYPQQKQKQQKKAA